MPETGYALAKVLCEQIAREMARWNPGTSFVGLRISNIFERPDYASIASFWDDPALRRWNLWSWVDARDVALACRLALEADLQGAEHFTIAAADTLMRESSAALMERPFRACPVKAGIGEFDTLLSIDKARHVLGYQPKHTWRGNADADRNLPLVLGAPGRELARRLRISRRIEADDRAAFRDLLGHEILERRHLDGFRGDLVGDVRRDHDHAFAIADNDVARETPARRRNRSAR